MKSTTNLKGIIAAFLFFMGITVQAQDYGKQCTISMQAVSTPSPAQITLSWPLRSDIKNYALQRKAAGTSNLTVNLAATTTGYVDTTAVAGIAYEYKMIGYPATSGDPTAYGSLVAGIELPLVESRGTVLLVVASNIIAATSSNLNRLADDLIGEGWTVDQLTVETTDSVASVKSQIVSRYNASASSLKSVILIGHVAVPYSGNINPDSHTEHKGAWPCDGFYGDIDGVWTDSTVNNATAARAENRNIPGDGKYDQSTFPSAVELSVGRIDFANLPSFAPMTEADLINRYLDKNHNFRASVTEVARKGLVDDNLASMREALSSSGRRAIAASVGVNNLIDGDFLTHGTPSLLGTGVGYGTYSSIEGVGTSSTLAAGTVNTVFNQHFGSYYGDWDSNDNVLRAVIAAQGVSLTSMWSGRPVLNLHGMALGRTVGECVRASMNQATDAYLQVGYNLKSVHVGLMGDPTLTLFTVRPISNLKAEITNGTAAVTWAASTDSAIAGYHIYRADAAGQPFVRRNSSLVATTTFSETNAPNTSRYMVRAVKLETSCSGTFFNASVGVSAVATVKVVNDAITAWKTLHFGAQANSEIAGDTADFDKDGVCNLLEYAMGTIPCDASSKSGLQNVCVTNTRTGRKLCATYSINNSAQGVRVTIQCSSDLQTWSPAPASTTLSSFGGYTMSQVAVPATGERCFLRVLVERI